jgi:Late embryogenesis abundant protein
LGLLGFALYRYFKVQADILKNFTWKVSAFKIVKLSKTEISIDVTFLFSSSADIEAKIQKLYLDIIVQGKNVGFIAEDKPFIIPAHGSSSVPLHISINPKSILTDVVSLVLGISKEKDVSFGLSGYANVKSGFISTTIPIKYDTTLKQYLKESTNVDYKPIF